MAPMIKKSLFLLAVAGVAASASACAGPEADTYHSIDEPSNLRGTGDDMEMILMFFFENVSNLACVLKESHVADNQDFEGISCDGNKLMLNTGRKKSARVAKEFTNGISGSRMLCTDGNSGSDHSCQPPKELNIFLLLDISFDYNGFKYDINDLRIGCIGQENLQTTNKVILLSWWIGSTTCKQAKDGRPRELNCDLTDFSAPGFKAVFTEKSRNRVVTSITST